MITPSCRNHRNPRGHHETRALVGWNSGWVGGCIIPLWLPTQKHSSEKQGNTKPGSLVRQADREKKKKQNKPQKSSKINTWPPFLEASSKSWINRCQQWHNLPGTAVGLVSSQLSFEEETVQGKKKKIELPPHAAPILSAEQLATAIPSQQQLGNQQGATKQQVPFCSWKERAGSGSNWLGKDFFQKTVLQGGI